MITIKDVQKAVTLEYLKDLEKWVDTDITNIGRNSGVRRQLETQYQGISDEELDKKELEALTDLKKAVQKRIIELKNIKIK